ncbi:unnamed protein product [Prunus armeniaca]|uniref:Uncharacterized protein n=1 Tax=Prunus armeniaca TaxID=36596 RepID=A0A6J5V663_PRUAR|nr:unnamed protein product [Prunus armeniaca]
MGGGGERDGGDHRWGVVWCGGGGGSHWGYQGIVGPISFGWALHLGGTDVEGVFLVCFGSIRLLPL